MVTAANVVAEIKKGFTTTEFYLSTIVIAVGAIVQFLPANVSSPAVKVAAAISAVLSALGYTYSRTVVKTTSQK